MKADRWKCKNCGAVYEDSDACPLCDSRERIEIEESGEIENLLAPKSKEKYISRYKKGRPIFKRVRKRKKL